MPRILRLISQPQLAEIMVMNNPLQCHWCMTDGMFWIGKKNLPQRLGNKGWMKSLEQLLTILWSELCQRPASIQSLLEIGLLLTFIKWQPHHSSRPSYPRFLVAICGACMFDKLIKMTELNGASAFFNPKDTAAKCPINILKSEL